MSKYVVLLHTRDEDTLSAALVEADSWKEAFEELGRCIGHNVPAKPGEWDWQDFITGITIDGKSTDEDFCRTLDDVETKSWESDIRGLYAIKLPEDFTVDDATYIVTVTQPHWCTGEGERVRVIGATVVRALSPRRAFESSGIPYDKDKHEGYVHNIAGKLLLGGHWEGTEEIETESAS